MGMSAGWYDRISQPAVARLYGSLAGAGTRLGVAAVAGTSSLFGRASRYVETVSYSATFLFHLIPAITETSTRLPVGAPLVSNRDGPELQAAAGVLFLAFLIGATLQVRWLRARG